MNKNKYAYCIVEFKCITCGSIESIWVSADVELAIMIPCRACQVAKRPINLTTGMLKFTGNAIRNDNYIPTHSERVIIEYTYEMSLLYNKMKVSIIWNKNIGGKKLSEQFKNMNDAALHIQQRYKTGKPFLITL